MKKILNLTETVNIEHLGQSHEIAYLSAQIQEDGGVFSFYVQPMNQELCNMYPAVLKEKYDSFRVGVEETAATFGWTMFK